MGRGRERGRGNREGREKGKGKRRGKELICISKLSYKLGTEHCH